ncbi:MAG: hypothetical protein OXG44_04800 [Gammaproteobacteria bacterium]|nr:hypothetical protein [Gammaproteobacteria bacterium]
MADTNRDPRSVETVIAPTKPDGTAIPAISAAEERELARAAEYVLADCFFAVGQTIGMRTSVDYEAVVWWHDHFRAKFLAALRRHGDRWAQDREGVTAVGWMLAERAVRHAAGRGSIDVETARRAAADVERYCQHRARRRTRSSDGGVRQAGLWCVPWPC